MFVKARGWACRLTAEHLPSTTLKGLSSMSSSRKTKTEEHVKATRILWIARWLYISITEETEFTISWVGGRFWTTSKNKNLISENNVFSLYTSQVPKFQNNLFKSAHVFVSVFVFMVLGILLVSHMADKHPTCKACAQPVQAFKRHIFNF